MLQITKLISVQPWNPDEGSNNQRVSCFWSAWQVTFEILLIYTFF